MSTQRQSCMGASKTQGLCSCAPKKYALSLALDGPQARTAFQGSTQMESSPQLHVTPWISMGPNGDTPYLSLQAHGELRANAGRYFTSLWPYQRLKLHARDKRAPLIPIYLTLYRFYHPLVRQSTTAKMQTLRVSRLHHT